MARILIADDEFALRDMVDIALSLQGHEVFQAMDGAEAFQIATDEKPDLVLLDINMPRLSGIETLALIRINVELAHIPVFFLSGYSNEKIESLCPQVDGIIQKPFDIDYLYERIDDVLKREKTR